MATLRKNASWILPLGLVLSCAAGWLLMRSPLPRAEAAAAAAARFQEGYTRLDPATAAQLDSLRREAGFDDDILGTLNLGRAGAVEFVAGVRNWFEANSTQLSSRRRALADQRSVVQHLKSRNDMGEDVLTEYRAARTALGQLESEYAGYLRDCRTQLLARLTEQQRAAVELMVAQRDFPMPYRTLSLSDDQKKALRKALIEYGQQRSNAADDETRNAARAAFDHNLAAALGAGNVQALETLRGTIAIASADVVSAINTVLPTEPAE